LKGSESVQVCRRVLLNVKEEERSNAFIYTNNKVVSKSDER